MEPGAISTTAPLPYEEPAFSPDRTVCAVMVTHCIGEALLETLIPLMNQVNKLIIIDNCSDSSTRDVLARAQTLYSGRLELLLRDSNNLAAAQNDGITRALESGFPWILLMDHDSMPTDGMVERLMTSWESLDNKYSVGIVAPCLTDIHSGRLARYPQAQGWLRCRRVGFGTAPHLDRLLGVISSGSLIPAEVFRTVGMMDETLCIDYVDKDFCLRVVRAGYRIVAVKDAVLRHQLGRSKDHRFLGLRITTTNHTPERCYYIYRNRIKSWGKHGRAVPAFVLYDVLAIGYDLMRLLCFEEQKPAKLHAMWKGLRDAALGISGPMSATGQR